MQPQAASAIDQLPPWLNRADRARGPGRARRLCRLGLGASRASIGRAGWSVTLPGGPLTLLQIGIGIVDLACCALAMYMLVPDEPQYRLHHAGGDLRLRDAARLCQPRARRPRRVRRRHAGRAVAVRQGRAARRAAAVPAALLHRPVRALAPDPGRRELVLAMRGTPPPPAAKISMAAPELVARQKPTMHSCGVERAPAPCD